MKSNTRVNMSQKSKIVMDGKQAPIMLNSVM